MGYEIWYLPLAHEDIQEIDGYLSGFYASTAPRVMKELHSAISKLAEMPRLHEKYHADPYYRKVVVDCYLVFYHVDDKKRRVEIHRVLHGARNIKHFLAKRNVVELDK